MSSYTDEQRRRFAELQRTPSAGEAAALQQVAEFTAAEEAQAAELQRTLSAGEAAALQQVAEFTAAEEAQAAQAAQNARIMERQEADQLIARGLQEEEVSARDRRFRHSDAEMARSLQEEEDSRIARGLQEAAAPQMEQQRASQERWPRGRAADHYQNLVARSLQEAADAEGAQQGNIGFAIQEVDQSNDWITQLFNTFDEDESRTIDMRELLSLFLSFPYSPINGAPLQEDDMYFIQQMLADPEVYMEADHDFLLYFNRFDTNHDGTLDATEFRQMIEAFPVSLRERIRTFMTATLQEQVQLVPEVRTEGPVTPFSIDVALRDTQVTFRDLLTYFKLWDIEKERAEIRARLTEASWAYVSGRVPACFEIHKSVYFTLDLNEGLAALEQITHKTYIANAPDATPGKILNKFNQHLLRGVDLHEENPIPDFGTWPIDGLRMLIEHLMTNGYEGLRGALASSQMVGGAQLGLPINRVMYLINHFLDYVIQPEHGRGGQLIYMSYVFSYLSLAVGGYGHSIDSYIQYEGREHPEGGMGIITGCAAGNADRVLLSFRMGLKLGVNKIAITEGMDPVMPANEYARVVLPPIDFPDYVVGSLRAEDVNPTGNSAEYITFGRLVGEYMNSPPHSPARPNTDLAGLKRYLVQHCPSRTEEERLEWLTKMAFFLEDPHGNPAWPGHSFIDEQDLKGGRLKRRARYTSKRGRRIKKNTTKGSRQVRKNKYIKKNKSKTTVKKRAATSKKSVKSITSSTKRVKRSVPRKVTRKVL